MTKWESPAVPPEKSGYYLCWNGTHHRPFVAWFDFNKAQFDTKKPVSYWAAVTAPDHDGQNSKS